MSILHRLDTSFSTPSLFGSVEADAQAEAIARLPGLIEWWSAHPSFLSTEPSGQMKWAGRVNGNVLLTPTAAVPLKTQGLNGRDTLEFDGSQEFDAPDFLLPANEITIAKIVRLTDSGTRVLYGPKGAAATPEAFSYAFAGGVARMVNSTFGSEIVEDVSGTYLNTDTYAMSTLSASRGMSMWRDGVEQKIDAADVQDLDDQTFGVGNFGTGSTSRFIGEVSDIIIFGVDYGSADYAGYNTNLQAALATYSGV